MKKKIITIVLLLLITASVLFAGLFSNTRKNNSNNIKYVFLFIGDGMSLPQVDFTEEYNNRVKGNDLDHQEQLSFTKFDTIGLRKNYSGDNYVTDSSASASALASGKLIQNTKVNLDKDGNKTIPITYDLKERKHMKIGIITNQSIDHATPAGFYAYCDDRNNYTKIAPQIATTNFDFFAGSHVAGYSKEFENSYKEKGYKYLSNQDEYNTITKDNKYIVVAPNNTVPYGIEQKEDDVSISKYLEMALKVVDNKDGFFLMVESGMIDTVAHNNDAKGVISEVNELDKAVNIALEFAKNHPNETLIIVTGDHETGSMSLGTFGSTYENLKDITMIIKSAENYLNNSKDSTQEKLKTLVNNFNIQEDSTTYDSLSNEMTNANGNYSKVIKLLKKYEQEISGINFHADNHTGLSVPVYVYGDKNKLFTGEYTTAEFNNKLRTIIK